MLPSDSQNKTNCFFLLEEKKNIDHMRERSSFEKQKCFCIHVFTIWSSEKRWEIKKKQKNFCVAKICWNAFFLEQKQITQIFMGFRSYLAFFSEKRFPNILEACLKKKKELPDRFHHPLYVTSVSIEWSWNEMSSWTCEKARISFICSNNVHMFKLFVFQTYSHSSCLA